MAAVAQRVGLGFPWQTGVLAVEVVDPCTLGGVVSTRVAVAVVDLGWRVCAHVDRWKAGFADSESCKTDGLGSTQKRRVRNPNKFGSPSRLGVTCAPRLFRIACYHAPSATTSGSRNLHTSRRTGSATPPRPSRPAFSLIGRPPLAGTRSGTRAQHGGRGRRQVRLLRAQPPRTNSPRRGATELPADGFSCSNCPAHAEKRKNGCIERAKRG